MLIQSIKYIGPKARTTILMGIIFSMTIGPFAIAVSGAPTPEALLKKLIQQKKFQSAIWFAQHRGETAKADELKTQLVKIMTHGKYKWKPTEGSRKKGTSTFVIEYEDGFEGLFKPDLRTNPKAIETFENQPLYEAAKSNTEDPFANSNSEVAADRLDQLLGLKMVPTTILLTVSGVTGSVQYLVQDSFHSEDQERYSKDQGQYFPKMRLLDYLLQNPDRHALNWMSVDLPGEIDRVFAIDHGCGLAENNSVRISYANTIKNLDDELKSRILNLKDQDVQKHLGDLMSHQSMAELLGRIHIIQNMIKTF
jgi:hypothetical protein